jgi:apolipoprotein N-acyltransferase
MRLSPLKWFPPFPLVLSALASGLLLAAAFPPLSLGPLSCVALIPVLVALHRRANCPRVFFKTGHLFGVAFFFAHLWWIVKLSPAASITVPWLMMPATIVLVLYLAVYPGLFFLLLRWIGRGRPLFAALLGPALWVIIEWIRSSGEFGFPWGSIGYSLVRYPVMMQGAALFGVLGLGALIVMVNMLWAGALLSTRLGTKGLLFAAGTAVLVLNVLGGKTAIERFDSNRPDKQFAVALVQPNIDLAVKWEPEFTDWTFSLIERLTRQAAGFGPGLVVFPETAAPVYLRYSLKYKTRLEDLARSSDAGIFIGFLDGRYDGPKGVLNYYNSSGLFLPNGDYAQYDKIHLLPFGEVIPFGWKFRILQKIDFGQANFQPGLEMLPIPSPVGNLAPLICFESTFPELSRKGVALGADVFVNITNDGWFGNTPGPYQHSDMAILRAVENRRFLLRSGNTGVTMVVDPVGRVTNTLAMNKEGFLIGKIHRVNGKTFYTRHGSKTVLLASLAVILFGLVTRPKSLSTR